MQVINLIYKYEDLSVVSFYLVKEKTKSKVWFIVNSVTH